jgi:hypothetical protein
MSRKRKQVVVMAPKSEPPTEKSSWPAAIGSLAIGAVVVIGVITIIGWVEVYTRPPPGWTCWRVERITADGRRMGGHCGPSPGWHIEQWENVGQVSVPNGVELRRRLVSD